MQKKKKSVLFLCLCLTACVCVKERPSAFVAQVWWHGEWNDKQKPVVSMSVAENRG